MKVHRKIAGHQKEAKKSYETYTRYTINSEEPEAEEGSGSLILVTGFQKLS